MQFGIQDGELPRLLTLILAVVGMETAGSGMLAPAAALDSFKMRAPSTIPEQQNPRKLGDPSV